MLTINIIPFCNISGFIFGGEDEAKDFLWAESNAAGLNRDSFTFAEERKYYWHFRPFCYHFNSFLLLVWDFLLKHKSSVHPKHHINTELFLFRGDIPHWLHTALAPPNSELYLVNCKDQNSDGNCNSTTLRSSGSRPLLSMHPSPWSHTIKSQTLNHWIRDRNHLSDGHNLERIFKNRISLTSHHPEQNEPQRNNNVRKLRVN